MSDSNVVNTHEKLSPLFQFDASKRSERYLKIAGVDEVGRGPLAGPVVAAAVIFFPQAPCLEVQDSKVLSPAKRLKLFQQIIRHCFVGIGWVDEKQIDEINIYQASRLAMKKAVLQLNQTPDLVLIDGNARLDLPLPQETIIKGDAKSASIAAASIIAKVMRDAWMEDLDLHYPDYQFKIHKGYPTPVHLEVLKRLGPTPVHRRSFGPVKVFFEKKLSL